MIKLITIDVWNTIYDSSQRDERHYYRLTKLKEVALKFGEFSDEVLSDSIINSWKYFDIKWKNEHRTPDAFETCKYLWESLEIENDNKAIEFIAKEFEDSLLAHPPKVLENFAEIANEMKKDFKLAIISDTGYSPGTILRQLKAQNNILHLFDSFSYSNETGVAKPDPKAFYTILNDLGISPNEAIHIGDIERTDIIGAKGVGMKAIRYNGSPDPFNSQNPKDSIADFQAGSWDEIKEIIYCLG